jgi:hypothetical protein
MSEDTTEVNPPSLSFKDALNALDTVSKDSFISEVWIPSLNRSVTVKEINARQQKNLLEAAIDSSVYKTTFSKAFYDIITSNVSEPKEILDTLTIADKIALAVALRSQISPTIKVEFEDGDTTEDISLKIITDKIKHYVTPLEESFEVVKNGVSISVNVILPTIHSEVQFDTFLLKNKKKTDDTEEVKTIITDAFLGETSKYIKNVSIDGEDLNYSSFSIHQKIQFVEKLPAAVIQKILDIIAKWKKELETLITVKASTGDYTKLLEVDSLLFLTN